MKKIRWKKIGGGSFRMKSGRIIKPNQIFEASVDEIPPAFRDAVIALEEIPEEDDLQITTDDQPAYKLVSRFPGWYDVVDKNGKVVNEKRLRKDEANELLSKLTQ